MLNFQLRVKWKTKNETDKDIEKCHADLKKQMESFEEIIEHQEKLKI